MKIDPVTGAIPVKFGDETIELRFTNSAYAYIEQEADVESAHDAIVAFMDGAMAGKVKFSTVIPMARAFLRAAKADPDLVDAASRDDLVAAVTALVLSVLDLKAKANPRKAAGRSSTPVA